jgi:hypothetical protein
VIGYNHYKLFINSLVEGSSCEGVHAGEDERVAIPFQAAMG